MPNLVPKLVHNFMAIVYLWRQIGDKIDTQISWPWKHFFASKIVLRVIVCCLRGVGSMSSSRRIPRFIVLFDSGHRRLFLASLSAYVVVASLLYLRVVGSSFRRLRYVLDSGKSTSQKQGGNHQGRNKEMSEFSQQLSPSYKLKNHRFSAVSEVIRLLENFRWWRLTRFHTV